MDILYELSYLFYQDAEIFSNKDPEYKKLKHLENQLFDEIPEELREKINDVQSAIEHQNLLDCFFYGLQVGFAASRLGQGG